MDARLGPVDAYGAPRTPLRARWAPLEVHVGPRSAQTGPLEDPWRALGGPLKGPWDPHRVQVWTHTVSKFGPTPCPRLDPHHVQVWSHTVSKVRTARFPGPRYCLIPWSQVLPHSLVPGTASFPGPKYCLIFWSQVLPMQGPKNPKKKNGSKLDWEWTF